MTWGAQSKLRPSGSRFKLPEKRAETVFRIIRETIDAKKIKLADPTATSMRYRSYLPFWV